LVISLLFSIKLSGLMNQSYPSFINYSGNFVYFRKIYRVVSYNISFAGAGRVAGALCREMYHKGYHIQQIVSENETHGRKLADSCNASWSSELIYTDSTNVIIVAVPDHKLKDVLNTIKCHHDTVLAHTAGSIGLDVFPVHMGQTGVLYPLQTFSTDRIVDFSTISFFLEASDNYSSLVLKSIAETVGGSVHFTDTEHRRLLHLAAVFVCNFTNHMLSKGKDISAKAGFSFEVLKPLIIETISKAMDLGPENAQTGPAVRFDLITIEKQAELLSFSPEMQNMYRAITRSIMSYYNKS
jgi:predicted short-subunit dehydrogenase-like oxidoreductase (DUF2520 family)